MVETIGRIVLTGDDNIKKIELIPSDLEFKNSINMPDREHIERAAIALETTKYEKTIHGEDATGNTRSAVGVLMSVLGWDGGTSALSENMAEAIEMRKQNSDKDTEDRTIYRQKVCDFLSEYIIGRMGFLCTYSHCSFKQIAQWLRLFLDG
jgi:hypothetical protein